TASGASRRGRARSKTTATRIARSPTSRLCRSFWERSERRWSSCAARGPSRTRPCTGSSGSSTSRSRGSRSSYLRRGAVVLDRAGSLEVLEQDRLDVEDELDLVAHDHAAAGELVLPRDPELVSVDPGLRLEAEAAEVAPVLVSLPERRPPLADVGDVKRDRAGHAANRQLDVALERGLGHALREPAPEADLRVIVHVEEVGAAELGVARRLAGPDAGRVDLTLEGR